MRIERFRPFPVIVVAACGLLGLLGAMSGFADDAKKDDAKASAASAAAKGDDCYKFVAPLEAIMEVMDDVFQGMPEKLKAGKYKDLKREALFVAEIANLATHVGEYKDNKDWHSLLESMKTSSLKMAEAAEKKDENGVKALHAKAEESCDTCHEKIRDA